MSHPLKPPSVLGKEISHMALHLVSMEKKQMEKVQGMNSVANCHMFQLSLRIL